MRGGSSLNEPPRILLNSADNGKHWLWLTLIGTYSCRDAIGAGVKLTTRSGRVLYNHVAISVGLMSSTDKRVHFGLDSESEVASIEIQWPRGTKQLIKDIKADQFLTVREPLPDKNKATTISSMLPTSVLRHTANLRSLEAILHGSVQSLLNQFREPSLAYHRPGEKRR
jgi:hypothetical protein